MNNARYVLALDPSGAFKEGLGTTGWCLFDQQTDKIVKFGFIYAGNFATQFKYWDEHIQLIDSLAGYHPDIVIEDYLLYNNKAEAQINSRFETPQLIGIIKYEAWKRGLYIHIQTAMQVKTRWSNDTLVHKGYIQKTKNKYTIGGNGTCTHILDSVRHAVHYKTYNSNYKGGIINEQKYKHSSNRGKQK